MAELDKVVREASEARSESMAAREEIQQAKEIAAGKPFLLRTKFGDLKYAPIGQLWSYSDAYLDLEKSAADATEYFKDQKDMLSC